LKALLMFWKAALAQPVQAGQPQVMLGCALAHLQQVHRAGRRPLRREL
jgi:hypothetical protein